MKLFALCDTQKVIPSSEISYPKSMNYEVDYQLNDFINMIDKHLKLIRSTKQKKGVGFVKILLQHFL